MSLMKLATSYLDISAEESKTIASTQNVLHITNKYNMARRHWWGFLFEKFRHTVSVGGTLETVGSL